MRHRPAPIAPLTVLTAVRRGAEAALADYLAALPGGADGPLRSLTGTHFARWVIVDQLRSGFPTAPWPPARLRHQYLLFTSTFNGSLTEHLEELRVRAGAAADAVWGHCAGYPGRHDRPGFHRYFRRHRVPTQLAFHAYPESVAQVRAALAVRAKHIAFAVQAQGLADKDLQRAYREHFGTG